MPNPTLNFFETYTLMACTREIVAEPHFFRDRYFPTGAGDLFNSDKVLTEYQKGDRRMACFVAPRVGDIPVDRIGYSIHEYQPAFIAPSRALTVDDLAKRGFGEALYADSTEAERAARITVRDLEELDKRIARREEWMAVQTMINNACTMQEFIDAKTEGDKKFVAFYDSTSDHTFTVANKWDTDSGNIVGDVKAMCKMLQRRGLPAADLVLGSSAAEAFLKNAEIRELLDKNLAYNFGGVNQTINYPGVVTIGTFNFGGFNLTVFDVAESYEDEEGNDTAFFPANAAMVTAPNCGHMMYGRISQIDYGQETFSTYVAKRVPKLTVNQEADVRKFRLAARPLAAPHNYCPYIFAAEVCE